MAVDWIGQHVYVVDRVGKKIDMVSLDGMHRKNVISYLVDPSDVVVDPNEGYVYLFTCLSVHVHCISGLMLWVCVILFSRIQLLTDLWRWHKVYVSVWCNHGLSIHRYQNQYVYCICIWLITDTYFTPIKAANRGKSIRPRSAKPSWMGQCARSLFATKSMLPRLWPWTTWTRSFTGRIRTWIRCHAWTTLASTGIELVNLLL